VLFIVTCANCLRAHDEFVFALQNSQRAAYNGAVDIDTYQDRSCAWLRGRHCLFQKAFEGNSQVSRRKTEK